MVDCDTGVDGFDSLSPGVENELDGNIEFPLKDEMVDVIVEVDETTTTRSASGKTLT